jgi:hypothetical protein
MASSKMTAGRSKLKVHGEFLGLRSERHQAQTEPRPPKPVIIIRRLVLRKYWSSKAASQTLRLGPAVRVWRPTPDPSPFRVKSQRLAQ